MDSTMTYERFGFRWGMRSIQLNGPALPSANDLTIYGDMQVELWEGSAKPAFAEWMREMCRECLPPRCALLRSCSVEASLWLEGKMSRTKAAKLCVVPESRGRGLAALRRHRASLLRAALTGPTTSSASRDMFYLALEIIRVDPALSQVDVLQTEDRLRTCLRRELLRLATPEELQHLLTGGDAEDEQLHDALLQRALETRA